MIYCKKCTTENKEGSLFCFHCGSPLEKKGRSCNSCGYAMDEKANFCKSCGRKKEIPHQQSLHDIDNTSARSATKKRKRWVLPVAITSGVVGLIVLCLAVLAIILVFNPIGSARNPSYVLSSEQKKLIDSLGYPDEFIISFDQENAMRSEVWTYILFEKSFFFHDGSYQGSSKIIMDGFGSMDNQIKPESFHAHMGPFDIIDEIGKKGDELIDNITYRRYLIYDSGKLICSFDLEDRLISVSKFVKPGWEID